MKEAIVHSMAEVESTHWWFAGRRAIVGSFLRRMDLPERPRILEVGCGTGGNFDLLARHGSLCAVDNDEVALEYATRSHSAVVKRGALPDDIPFAGQEFDLVVLMDVLEHVDDDVASLEAIRNLTAPEGRVLITVPAFGFLWSSHDDVHHHRRRYTKSDLTRKVTRAGIRIEAATYFNTILFPLVGVVRWLERGSPTQVERDLEVPPRPLNHLLEGVFGFERHLLRWMRFPYGVSLLLVGSR